MLQQRRSIGSSPRALNLVAALVVAGLLAGCGAATATEAPTPVPPTAEGQVSSPPPPPEVQVTFDTDSASLQPGECAILQWHVEGGEITQLDGQPVDVSGQETVCPDATTTYTLAVYVGVGPPAPPHTERQVVISVGTAEEAPTEAPALPPAAPVVSGVTEVRDLVYGSYVVGGSVHELLLDLYLPKLDTVQPLPTLIFIHGGGWFEGSKDVCPGRTLARYGYAVACVDYRLADFAAGCPHEVSFPSQIHDVKAAVRWLRSSAGFYGLDPSRFGALGDSSGGHLAALLGTSSGVDELEGWSDPGVSAAIQALAVWYGPVDVTQSPVAFEQDPCTTDLATLNQTYGGEETPYFYWTLAWATFLGGSLADPDILDRAARASPLTYVDAGDPPFLVIQGQGDTMIPAGQSDLLVAALTDVGVEVEFVQPAGVRVRSRARNPQSDRGVL